TGDHPSVASCVVSRRPGAGNRGREQGDQRSIESLRDLIRQTSKENPRWGASRIHGELLMLGFEVAQSTASVRRERQVRSDGHGQPEIDAYRHSRLRKIKTPPRKGCFVEGNVTRVRVKSGLRAYPPNHRYRY